MNEREKERKRKSEKVEFCVEKGFCVEINEKHVSRPTGDRPTFHALHNRPF